MGLSASGQSGTVALRLVGPQKLRVLLVEDKAGAAARLKGQLESQGHRVVGVARNGRQALEGVRRLRPALVIIELQLAGLDGIEVARRIVANRPLPVVLLSGHDAADFVRRAREAGIMATLVTPADARRLDATMDVALARFREFQAIRRETDNLAEALVVRNDIEGAKRVLMRCLKISEADAFRHLWRARTKVSSLDELAVSILRSEKLLTQGDLIRNLRAVLPAIRRGLTPVLSSNGSSSRASRGPASGRSGSRSGRF